MKPFLRPVTWLAVSVLHVGGGFSFRTKVTMSTVFSVILPSVAELMGCRSVLRIGSGGAGADSKACCSASYFILWPGLFLAPRLLSGLKESSYHLSAAKPGVRRRSPEWVERVESLVRGCSGGTARKETILFNLCRFLKI